VRKQFVRIGGRRLYEYPLSVLREAGIEDVILVLPEGEMEDVEGVRTVEGGAERMDSVFNGVRAARGEYVLVHDSARANLSVGLVRRLIEAEGDVVVPAVRPPDSVFYAGRYINRDEVLLVQTPQRVRRTLLMEAYERAKAGGRLYTDEGSLILGEMGVAPKFVEGERWNFKITYPSDMEVFRRLKMSVHTLFGYDVHRLVPGRPLYLAGVKVADDFGALGHSDGDAVLHAVVDALLSFMGFGDIGTVFSDTDARWEGVRSEVFAAETARLAEERGIEVLRLDLTVVLERPKLRGFKGAMIENLSRLFNLPSERISLKAKSGNGLHPNSIQVFAIVEVGVAASG